jgi:hypothetical protein
MKMIAVCGFETIVNKHGRSLIVSDLTFVFAESLLRLKSLPSVRSVVIELMKHLQTAEA